MKSKQTAKKSENMISAIGFKPVIAAHGGGGRSLGNQMSRTRNASELLREPTVALNTAGLGHVTKEHNVEVAAHLPRNAPDDQRRDTRYGSACQPHRHKHQVVR